MKVLSTSDTHGNFDKLDLSNIDLAVFAGDIAPLHNITSWDAYDQLKWMNTKFYDWCMQWPKTKIVFVPGNHDFFPVIKETFGYKLAGKDLSLKLAPNTTMLVDESIDIHTGSNDYVKVYGTPWVPIINYRWAFEAEHDKLVKKFSQIPSNVDILLTHTPPRYKFLDVSLEYGVGSDKFGSHELVEAIFEKEPKLCFCGHIHSGSHEMSILGKTQVWNVSRVNESYEIAYEPIVIDI